MTTAIILCEGATLPVGFRESDSRVLRIAAHGAEANLRLEMPGPSIYQNLGAVALDLVHLAAYVYTADRLLSRGAKDVYGERWKRRLHFVVPVRARAVWEASEVTRLLGQTLGFLSDDSYTFTFVDFQQDEPTQQTYLALPDYDSATSVALFSGGLDSLAGVVWDHVANGERPILVSHRPAFVISKRQKDLVK